MFPTISLVLVLTCTVIFNVFPTKADDLKTYIVHLSLPEGQDFPRAHEIEEWYNSFLSKIPSRPNEKPKMVYAYRHVITGFAAKLSVDQAEALENLSGVVSVRPEGVYQLQTTRSSYFLGLRQDSGLWKDSNKGKGVIIGIMDTGVTPGHPSFNDNGVPAPPSTWKGKCEVAGCNNKLIGLRSFVHGISPMDEDGHGTHTSSTAAGNSVDNANVFGMANGTASGMAPLAHLAMYKVCTDDCLLSDILAGMDAAIKDGVNVMSLSLGGDQLPFHEDSMAIGAFNAMQKGIFVSFAAGNEGPLDSSLSNEAPWMLTVGASTIDRRITTSAAEEERMTEMTSGWIIDNIPTEAWKCLREEEVYWLTSLFDFTFKFGKMSDQWRTSDVVPLYKNKGDAQCRGNFRGVKLLSHTMKLWERVIETRIRRETQVTVNQLGFMSGRLTTEAIHVLRRLVERYWEKKRDLHIVFIDLEKAYDSGTLGLIWDSLESRGVPWKYIDIIRDMYVRTQTRVRLPVGDDDFFLGEVGLHQGSALSLFLFTVVLDELTRSIQETVPWCMLFADDIVLIAETKQSLNDKLEEW
ncbi:putative cucumisin [Helianthus annuus]|nr:putative cucumisin [Helianthus annuus]